MILIVALAALALGLAGLLRAPRGTWRYIAAAAVLAAFASQLLPPGHPFRADVADSSRNLFWLGVALIPLSGYALLIRRLRRRTGADAAAPRRPVGLVQIAEDTALAADTETALAAEAAAAIGAAPITLSLGWRADDGALAGHLRLRRIAATAEVIALRVAPAHRRRGIGRRLLAAAEDAARAAGARRMAVAPGSWQAPGFFERAGYRTVAARPLGDGVARLWMERDLA